MGRPRKTLEQHQRDGTYQPCRHGDWAGGEVASGKPEKPSYLKGDARVAWEMITQSLHPEALQRIDTLLLIGACRWWAHWRRWDAELEAGQDDYKVCVQASTAWKNVDKALTKLGLTPTERSKLHVPAAKPEDAKSKFFKVHTA